MRIVRPVRHATCVLAVLLLAGFLAACGGGGGSDTANSAARELQGGQDRGAKAGRGTGGANNRQGAPEPQTNQSVVYTARLRVSTPNVDQATAKAKQITLAAGGYVQNESSTAGSDTTITLKIPSDRHATVLNDLGRLGRKLSQSQNAEDVAREVADVDSRVRSAEAVLASFRKLLDRTTTVREIINVRGEIAEREAELEALQARQRALQHSTRYATTTLVLTTPPRPDAPPEKDEGGFVGGLKDGWATFTTFLSAVALVVGWLLPFLALAALFAFPAHLVWRRLRSRRPIGSSGGLPPK